MPRHEDLKAQVARELRAAVATQRRRDDAPGGAQPPGKASSQELKARPTSRSGPPRVRPRVQPAETVARWFYPLSSRRGTGDQVWYAGGRLKRVTLEGFAALTRPGHLKSDPWWVVTTNHRRIREGDFVYFYADEDDAGIVGFATIKAKRTIAQGRTIVQLQIDTRLSQRLVRERPITATSIRRWLPLRKRPVESLTAFSHRLDLMFSRFYSHGGHIRRAHEQAP